MNRALVILLMAMAMWSCKNEPAPPSERPGTVEPTPEFDISGELSNSAQRIVLPDTTVYYDDCGVIFGKTVGGTIFIVDVASGWRADYNPTDTTLLVNGTNIPIREPYIAKRDEEMQWLVAKTDNGNTMVLVTKCD